MGTGLDMTEGPDYAAIKREKRCARIAICKDALARAKVLSDSLIPKSDMQKLVDKLAAYLVERQEEEGDKELLRRVQFVGACLQAISTRDQTALDALLADENVKPFKGCFSQRLYNTVKPFQFFSEKRQKEVAQAVPDLPKTLIEIIAGYDKGLHCYLDEPAADFSVVP